MDIGRDPSSDIVLESDSVSRRHARIEPSAGGHRVVDNLSTNGTYLNNEPVQGEAPLRSGDYVQIGEAIFKYLAGDEIENAYHEEIYRLTIEDGLTQTANKRALTDFLEKEFARAKRYERALSVVLFDLDHFKRINDEYGHLMGDYVLREVAKVIKTRVRREEMFARYGGEEFCIVLPEMSLEDAMRFAETVREMVEVHPFKFENNNVHVTVSIGVATVTEEMARPEALILAADQNLYRAKRSGRNRVLGPETT
jgi:two-component system cell cycle response regulator